MAAVAQSLAESRFNLPSLNPHGTPEYIHADTLHSRDNTYYTEVQTENESSDSDNTSVHSESSVEQSTTPPPAESATHQAGSIQTNTVTNTQGGTSPIMSEMDNLVRLLTAQIKKADLNDLSKVDPEFCFVGTGATSHPGTTRRVASDVREYIEGIEVARQGDWDDQGKIQLVIHHTYGHARKAALKCQKEAGRDYATFLQLFKSKFPVQVTCDKLYDQISQAKRKAGETLEIYLIRLLDLADKIVNLDSTKKDEAHAHAVRSFLRVLPTKLSERITDAQRNDTDKLIDTVMKWVESRPEVKLGNDYIIKHEKPKEVMAVTTGPSKKTLGKNTKQTPNQQLVRSNTKPAGQTSPNRATGTNYCTYHLRKVAHTSEDCSLNPANKGKDIRKANKDKGTSKPPGKQNKAKPEQNKSNDQFDLMDIQCSRCRGWGHYAKDCGTNFVMAKQSKKFTSD